MEEIISNKEIIKVLYNLQKEMKYLREHIQDITLTKEDLESIEKSEKELQNNQTISLENLKNQIQDA